MTTFEIGRTYTCRSACDYDCIFRFEVIARTAQTVTIRGMGAFRRRKIYVRDGVEYLDPIGKYSMAPVLRADRDE